MWKKNEMENDCTTYCNFKLDNGVYAIGYPYKPMDISKNAFFIVGKAMSGKTTFGFKLHKLIKDSVLFDYDYIYGAFGGPFKELANDERLPKYLELLKQAVSEGRTIIIVAPYDRKNK